MIRLWVLLALVVGAIGAGIWWFGAPGPITGVVLDENGKPIAGAEVHLEKEYGEEMFPVSMRWEDLRDASATTQADGRFLIEDPDVDGNLRVVVDDGYSGIGRIPVQRGDPGVEVILEPAWKLTGKLSWDTDAIPGYFLVVLMQGEGELLSFEQPRAQVDPILDDFWIEQVEPGTYQLVVLHEHDSHPLYTRELVLDAGGGSSDLGHIDLRGEINSATLTLVGVTEEDAPMTTVVDLLGRQMAWAFEGKVTVYFTEESVDLILWMNGYRDVLLEDVRGDREVSLTPGIPIEIAFDAVPNFPEDIIVEITLLHHFEAGDPATPSGHRGKRVFSNYGGPDFQVPAPGAYQVMVRLMEMSEDFDTSPRLLPFTYVTTEAEAPIIHVKESEEMQLFQISMSQSTVWRAITRLRHLDWPE
ncbi:MAG: carboxypeptidase-like regulatory domain-containing protein [Planctomycetota bacterium]